LADAVLGVKAFMNPGKKVWLTIWICFFGIGLLGILFVYRSGQQQSELTVGVIYAGTGPASFAGKPEHDVLTHLEADYLKAPASGKRFKLVFRDSGGDNDKAIRYLEEFSKNKQCIAIIGPTGSGESIAVAAKVGELQDKIPVLSLAASSKIVQNPADPSRTNDWVFKFAQNDSLAAEKLAAIIKSELDEKSVVFLHSDDGFGKSGAGVFPGVAKTHGLNLSPQLFSFGANLSSPRAIVDNLPNSSEGFVIWGSAPGPAMLVRVIREKNPNARIYLSHGNASQDFIDSVGGSGNGIVVVGSRLLMPQAVLGQDSRDQNIKKFQDFWLNKTGKPQSHFAGHAYDAYQLLRQIVNGGDTDRVSIRKKIETTSNFQGITGVFRFSESDHAGLDVGAFEVFRIQDSKFVPYK
jgi:branched-chain amino acid transport system substrate-binding protein